MQRQAQPKYNSIGPQAFQPPMQCLFSLKKRKKSAIGLSRRWRKPSARDVRQSGFTLIEVLIGLALTAILVLGMSGLWTTVNDQFLYLTLKQKAVFVLNGEMERLSSLHRYTNFASSNGRFQEVVYENDNLGDDLSDPANLGVTDFVKNRFIFISSPVNISRMVVSQQEGTASLFDCPINETDQPATTQFNSECAGRILVDENGAGTDDDRNYVWIDQERRITARLSWRLRSIKTFISSVYPNVDKPCWDNAGGTDCKELTLYLHFPFRYSSPQEPDRDAGFGRRETLVLKTFVGRR